MNHSDLFMNVLLLFLKNLGLFAITGLKLKYVQMIHWMNKNISTLRSFTLRWSILFFCKDDSAKMGETEKKWLSDCQITPLLIMETSYNLLKIAVLIQQHNQ